MVPGMIREEAGDRRKRKRDARADSEEDPGCTDKINAKQILDSVKGASTEHEYRVAVARCSRALSGCGPRHPARLQLLLARSAMYSVLEESQGALKDAKAAVVLSPNSAPVSLTSHVRNGRDADLVVQAYLRAAKAFHQAKLPGKARQALEKAESLDRTQSKKLQRHIDQLKRTWEPHGLLALPGDVMYGILSLLDTPDLYACFSTCRSLRQLLTHQNGIWGRNVKLTGTLAKLERRWKRLYTLLRGQQVHSLSLSVTCPCPVSKWTSGNLRSTFPFATLRSLKYQGPGDEGGQLDTMVWNECVVQCKRLESLCFVNTARQTSLILPAASPLASCRLAELELDRVPPYDTEDQEDPLIRLVSKTRKLCLTTGAGIERVKSMVEAAKETVEQLDITVMQEGIKANFDRMEAVVLRAAQSLSMRWESSGSMLHLQAPQAKKLSLVMPHPREDDAVRIFTHNLLQSCTGTLTDLSYHSPSPVAAKELDRALPGLNMCEKISMSFAHSASVPVFWSLIEAQSLVTDSDIRPVLLPRLSHLSINGDRTLRGGELIRLVRQRRSSALRPIDELNLSHCDEVHWEAVARLRRLVSRFSFSSC